MIEYRSYGTEGPPVVVLHGGPAATGSAAPIAQGISDSFRVVEPLQRGSGGISLTVATHIADLLDVIDHGFPNEKPAVVGESWGAMLALAFAAEYTDRVGPLALIGCGTFDEQSRLVMNKTLQSRMKEQNISPQGTLKEQYQQITPLYHFDRVDDGSGFDLGQFDEQAHRETWDDMIRLEKEGFYPRVFTAIKNPVKMFHGTYDPHPGEMIYNRLSRVMPQLDLKLWDACGHCPWLERQVSGVFFEELKSWLLRYTGQELN